MSASLDMFMGILLISASIFTIDEEIKEVSGQNVKVRVGGGGTKTGSIGKSLCIHVDIYDVIFRMT